MMFFNKILILLLLSLFCFNSFSMSRVERRNQIIRLIDQELHEVNRLTRATGNRNPEHLLRMAELLLEKARHLKDAENDRFLRMDPEKRQRVNREEFFKNSRQHFIQAQRTCQHILRHFPNFRDKAEVLYILAYNAKEFQREEESQRYFTMAVNEAPRNSEVRAKSQLGLAEIYYNQKNYRKAAPLYREALNVVDDQWWTKDAFNLAWAEFRNGRQNEAIRLMRQVYERSKNPKYVDMSYSVERDLAYFYTESGNLDEAVRFYRKQGGDIASNLIRVGRYLNSQGQFAAAEKAFSEALNHPRTEQDNIEINHQLLSLYDRFGNYERHLQASKRLFDFHQRGRLQRHQVEDLTYHVQNMSARLQRQVAGENQERHRDDRDRRARLAVEYFQLVGALDESTSYKANFHAAETHYASENYDEAIQLYDRSYHGARAKGDRKIAALSLDGMMSALGSQGVSQSIEDQYLEPAYLAFLQAYPRREESNTVFQRLFNHYMDQHDIENAERTLNSYSRNFPSEGDTQEAMLAKIMDYYRDRNDDAGIRKWVQRINQGDFRVSRSYAEQVRLLLLSMQFDQVEKYTSKGDRKEALRGYVSIYASGQSSEDAKKNAAYNIATLFHELGDPDRTYGWSLRAISHMNANEVQEFETTFLNIAVELFNRRRIKEAANLNTKVYQKLCQTNARNKESFFKNANVLNLAQENRQASIDIINSGRRCGVSNEVIRDAQAEHLSALLLNESWGSLEDYIKVLKSNRANWPELIFPLSQLRDELKASGRVSAARQKEAEIVELFRGVIRDKRDAPIEALDVVAEIRLEYLKREFDKLKSIQLSFPEEVYNRKLEDLFDALDKLTEVALDILDIGSGKGIVSGYRYLVEAYEFAARSISSFTPEGESESYQESFKSTMRELATPLMSEAREFRRRAIEQINRGDILSRDTYWFLSQSADSFRVEYQNSRGAILMDRGGRR